MSESSVRDLIARALHRQETDDGEVHVLWGGASEHEEEVAEWLPFADAVLAVLADLPDDVIEDAARALFLEDANVSYVEWPEWDSAENLGKPIYMEIAAAALQAAFGGEQGE